MKANELRIGNWVLFDIEEVYEQITPRRLGFISQANSKGHYHPFKPIPLSEEILLKCGFEKRTENDSFQLDSDLGFTIWGRIKSGLNVYCNSDILGQDIKHLHQLQNLYFALTGEELNIEL